MLKKRPCTVCRKWFMPHPRLGDRQRTCADPACRRELHRRSCAAYREQEREAVQEERVRARIADDSGGLDRAAVRDAIGLQQAVVLEEFARVLVPGTRDAFRAQVLEVTIESVRLHPRGPRDAIGGPAP